MLKYAKTQYEGNDYSYISFIHPIPSQTTVNNTSTVDCVQRPTDIFIVYILGADSGYIVHKIWMIYR